MKKLAAMLCLSVMATGAFAQGLVNFANNPQTLVSANINGNLANISGPSGSYYFALLTATAPTGPFTFTGLLGTNLVNATGGRFSGGNGVAVPNWAPGTTLNYEIAGWDASLGSTFNPAWLTTAPSTGLFGISAVGSGVAGGGAQSLPTLQLFGGTGITSGFSLTGTGPIVPEPSSMALAGLGAAALLIFRRRK
jgi:hypothetical protein